MIVAWAINISELSVKYRRIYSIGNIVKYRRIYSVGNSNGEHRRNISVGNCGMSGNFFATLGKTLTVGFHL
jgi:hypothetical protein